MDRQHMLFVHSHFDIDQVHKIDIRWHCRHSNIDLVNRHHMLLFLLLFGRSLVYIVYRYYYHSHLYNYPLHMFYRLTVVVSPYSSQVYIVHSYSVHFDFVRYQVYMDNNR